jgi:transposase-like protein
MPRKPRKWSDERVRRLIELWLDPRYSINAIARELGTDHTAVRRRAKYLGLTGRRTNRLSPWLKARRELLRTIGSDHTAVTS